MAGELRIVTWYFRSGRSDAATRRSTVFSIIARRRGLSYSPPYEARMRACSRRVAGSRSGCDAVCGTGNETRRGVDVLGHAESSKPKAATTPNARPAVPVVSVAMPHYSQWISTRQARSVQGSRLRSPGRFAVQSSPAPGLDFPPTVSDRGRPWRIPADDAWG